MSFYKPLNYRETIKKMAQEYKGNIAPHFTAENLPAGAILVSKGDGDTYFFRRVNEHGTLFEVQLGSPEGINELARQKIQELGLENERFFFQMGHKNEFIEATQRLVG